MSSTAESPTLTTSLRTAAVSNTSTSKHKPVRLCFRCARSHRISRARKPQVWLSPRNKACLHLQGHWIFTAKAALDYEALFALPRTLVHGDLHHHNVLVDSQGKASAILDWEECGTGVAVRVSACFLVGECGDVPHSTR